MQKFPLVISLLVAASAVVACSSSDNNNPRVQTREFAQTTVDIASKAQPAFTPGSPGVVATNEKMILQFSSANIDLNQARYTRYYLSDRDGLQPDAIVVLIPGFEGGASNFYLLAENLLLLAALETNLVLEIWAVDRRSNQLEDTVGLDIAEDLRDPHVGLDFLFGDTLGLELSQELVDGPNRRAVFYNSNTDTAFLAQWTPLVHSQDIDAVVEAAQGVVRGSNVFLGGHSAGTGFTARYAATNFNLDPGDPEPGYKKLRGLILLEGGGSSIASEPITEEELDMIEASFDGGLYGAVRDQAPRCIDGVTACSAETAASDCSAFDNMTCVEPQSAFTELTGLLSPQLLAVSEVNALDAVNNDDTVQSILQEDQNGIEGNNAAEQVPELSVLIDVLGSEPASSVTLLGKFIDDDGAIASAAFFVATSVGFEGPVVDGVTTWLSKGEPMPPEALTDNGPAPVSIDDIGIWGKEVEPTDLEGRMLPSFYRGRTNFSEWYYPGSGLGITSELGLDSTALSAPPPLGRGRSDIENLTQAAFIDVPVIAFGGSNGLAQAPGDWLGFADAIGPCMAPTCDGMTPRILDRVNPSEAFPTYGGISGGFEVYISEGYAHLDVLSADDDETNNVVGPLLEFISRNLQ